MGKDQHHIKPVPPRFAIWLLELFCASYWLDEILGDMEEAFLENYATKGKSFAIVAYYWTVLTFLRPHIIRPNTQYSKTGLDMLYNYLTSAVRNLRKNKIYSTINFTGLSVGICCCVLISLYVHHESQYDTFFDDADRIYRVALERQYPDHTRFFATSPVNMAEVLKENYPQVENATRLHRLFFQSSVDVTIGDQNFAEHDFLFADEQFFDVFSFEFVEGTGMDALDDPGKIVLTESTALKYFGNASALGRTVLLDTASFIISGVIRDLPENSHMKFDVLGSIWQLTFLDNARETNSWINPWLNTYVKLKPGIPKETLQSELPQMVKDFGFASIQRQLNISAEEYESSGHGFHYFMQPLTDIHLHSNLDAEIQANGNVMYVYLLSVIVIFILIISCINFINLATAKSSERAKEVGVRKVMGGTRTQLVSQFLVESVLITFIATLLGIVLSYILLPSFNQLIDKSLTIAPLLQPVVLVLIISFIFLLGIIAGLYPAFMLSNFRPTAVLKGSFRTSNSGVWLRNSLIVFQFFISAIMITGTLVLNKQLRYINKKDLGFEKDNTLIVRNSSYLAENWQVFRTRLEADPGVDFVLGGFGLPGDFLGNSIMEAQNPEYPALRVYTNTIDEHYIPGLGMHIKEGRNFDINFNDSLSVLINEAAADLIGGVGLVGTQLRPTNTQPNQADAYTIIGIVEDFHQQSLHSQIQPLLFFKRGEQFPPFNMAVKLNSNENIANQIAKVESLWTELVSEAPFTYTFLDDHLDQLYEGDNKSQDIFGVFTMAAIIMACVGLFGLSAYVAQQRTKEIGVRKVLGASIGNIILLLSADFTKLIVVAYALAIPAVYYGMSEWLDSFAYHTNVDVFTVLIAGLLTLVLAWLTTAYQSIKAGLVNPTKSLRSE